MCIERKLIVHLFFGRQNREAMRSMRHSCVIFLNQRRHHSLALTEKVTRKEHDKRPGRTHPITKTTETERIKEEEHTSAKRCHLRLEDRSLKTDVGI